MAEHTAVVYECDAPECDESQVTTDARLVSGPMKSNHVTGPLPPEWVELDVLGDTVQVCPHHRDLTVEQILDIVVDAEEELQASDDESKSHLVPADHT